MGTEAAKGTEQDSANERDSKRYAILQLGGKMKSHNDGTVSCELCGDPNHDCLATTPESIPNQHTPMVSYSEEYRVRAVNCHEELLAALKAVRLPDVHAVARDMIVRAIAKAEGK